MCPDRCAPFRPIRGGANGDLTCQVEELGGAVVVRAAGEVDLSTAGTFRSALSLAVERDRHIVVDLAKVTYIDSTGFKELLVCHATCERRGRILALANPHRVTQKVLGILNLDQVLPIFSSVEEAVRGLPSAP